MEWRRGRCWHFANCTFDEGNWALSVDGRRVAVESKPIEVLRQLLLRSGNLVSKSELLDSIWPDLAVVEASLPTAVHKLRVALDDEHRPDPLIETVARKGYRLTVPVEIEEAPGPPGPMITQLTPGSSEPAPALAPSPAGQTLPADTVAAQPRPLLVHRLPLAAAVIGVLSLTAAIVVPARHAPAAQPRAVYSQQDVLNALRRLDVARIDAMIADGWNPGEPIGRDRNNALDVLLEMCEWNPAHDRARMLVVARALLDGGVDLTKRNIWGDTPYSIASAPRYCGPDHPVTRMIHNMCFSKSLAAGRGCLADYKHYKQID